MRPLVLLLLATLASCSHLFISSDEEDQSSTTALLGHPEDWNQGINPWEDESCCSPSHRPELQINGQDSDELTQSVAGLHNILFVEAITSILSTSLFSIMLYFHSNLCVGEHMWPMLTAWVVYLLSHIFHEGLMVWEISLMLIGFIMLDDKKSKVMMTLALLSTLLPMTQFFGLIAFKNDTGGGFDPLNAICNMTSPTEGFIQPRWLATQIVPGILLFLISGLLMILNNRMLVSYRSRINLYD